MALRLLSPPLSTCCSRTKRTIHLFLTSKSTSILHWRSPNNGFLLKRSKVGLMAKACVKLEEESVSKAGSEWGKVSAVLFDMDGVLCNSEEPSRMAAVEVFAEMGVQVTTEDFVPFMGTGEAKFLGGVAAVKGVKDFDPEAAKKKFFEIYLAKYAKPNSGIGFPGALELITQCKNSGLKVAVASSADRIKVDANLAAAGLPISMFDAIVSADAFQNLKPAPDIFLAASKILDVSPSECIVIEDALAGVQAAKAAQMRCIAVTTTLAEDILTAAGPSLVRKEISNVTLDDILTGGSGYHNKGLQGPQSVNYSAKTSTEPNKGLTSSTKDAVFSIGGLQGSRRDVLRYGSLGISVSCLVFAISNRKAMQYASPRAIWNLLFGVSSPPLEQNEADEYHSERIQQFINYISDLEDRKTATIVPEFPSKLDWLNSAPLQLRRDLKGKVVVLDFWTYCCINCMHVLPDLAFLEKKYKDMPFVVVGVHSAKFDNEKDLEAIRSAVLRYDITHPVVNDGDMNLWRELGVNSWPTFTIVAPNGKVIAQLAGEGRRKDLDDLVEAALLYYGKKNLLDNTPIPLNLEKDNDPRLLTSPLKFPGKLAADVANNRLFISDSNHNRIVVTDLNGNFIVQIGSTGEEGLHDGNFDDATFSRPQGLAYNPKKNLLYVADTENHALRVVDFVNETVGTLAGNGTKGSDYKGGRTGNTQLLNSPWDVCFDPVNEIVYIAMAGQHQIWVHDTLTGVTRAFSGNGYERNLNGSSSESTSFAQPSGISLSPDLKEAYIADSESSSIRALDLKTGGSRLLAGGDPFFSENLFRFGDHDGVGAEVLLQHPLGVLCGKDGQIYLADSYNHKIKKLDPASKRVSTLAGTGKAGFKDGTALEAQLSEPSGLVEVENALSIPFQPAEPGTGILVKSNGIFLHFNESTPAQKVVLGAISPVGRFKVNQWGERLYIADTNNSLIRYIDLTREQAGLYTLELKGVQPPVPKSRTLRRLRRRTAPDTEKIVISGGSSSEGKLYLKISVPEGYHFSKEAQSKFSVDVEPENAALFEPLDGYITPDGSAMVHFRRSSPLASTGRINCKVYYCKEDEVCLYQPLTFEVPFQEVVPDSAPTEITLPYVVKPKTPAEDLQLPLTR